MSGLSAREAIRSRVSQAAAAAAALAVLAGLAAACGEDDAGRTALGDGSLGTVAVAEGQAIQIRALLSTTEIGSGITNERIVRMAVADYGPIHGFEVNLESLDEHCTAAGGESGGAAIVGEPDVAGVIGTTCSVAAIAAAPLVTGAGLAMISPSNTSPLLTSDGTGVPGPHRHEGYYRTSGNDLHQGAAVARFLHADQGVAAAAVVHTGDAYTASLADAFVAEFERLGGRVTGVGEFADDEIDVVGTLEELAAGRPEGLFMSVSREVGTAIVQARGDVAGLAAVPLVANEGLIEATFMSVPTEVGGLGADFVGYALVAEEMGRHCATTALTFNMHTATALLSGPIAEALLAGERGRELDPDGSMAAHLAETRPHMWEGMVHGRVIHSQPFSEGQAPGARSGFSTVAVPTEGGYRVTGRKIFASLSGAAHVHNVLAVVEGDPHIRLLGVPADGDGAEIVGDWDPIGMRGTDSRTLVMDDVFVPARNEVLPPGMFNAMVARFPQFYMSLTFSYLGLMRAILDATRAYLRGESGVKASRDHPIKQTGWAQLQLVYDRAQSLTYRVLSELRADPSPEELRRAHVATVTTMESAPEMASLALRTCGGRSLLRLGRNGLYDDPTDHD